MTPPIRLRHALPEEAEEVYSLYRSVIGREFCVWNEHYPGREEIACDLATENLYLLTDDAALLGAISVVPENELDDFPVWQCSDGSHREIARVVIAEPAQGRGLAAEMVNLLAEQLRTQGCRSIHLSVAKSNLPAYKTYLRTGFSVVGEAELYGGNYDLMERLL